MTIPDLVHCCRFQWFDRASAVQVGIYYRKCFMSALLSIATAVPDHRITQSEVLAVLAKARGAALPARLEQILGNSGIDQRYLACEADYYLEPRSWTSRAAIYGQVGTQLAQKAAADAMAKAGFLPSDIDAIVLISTTGTMTPSIPSRMIEAMGFDEATQTIPVFGHGCAGGVLGLRLADDLAAANGGQNVLLIALELCSLSYDYSQFDKKNMIATALFADGCAAAVISGKAGEGDAPAFRAFQQKTWPDTRDRAGRLGPPVSTSCWPAIFRPLSPGTLRLFAMRFWRGRAWRSPISPNPLAIPAGAGWWKHWRHILLPRSQPFPPPARSFASMAICPRRPCCSCLSIFCSRSRTSRSC